MDCPKCGGRMSFEEFFSSATEVTSWAYAGWRCIHCGEIIDPLILLNRKGNINRKTVSVGKEANG